MDNLIEHLNKLSPEKRKLVLQKLQKQKQLSEVDKELPILPVSRDKTIPLSFAQQRLWFLDQLEPGSHHYHIPMAIRLSGALNRQSLQKAFDTIVKRHESLRTTFIAEDGIPKQVISENRSVDLPVIDLSEYPKVDQEAEVQRLLRTEVQKPFNLSSDLMLRITLLRLDREEHVLLLVVHHIASDVWSMGVLWREISILYTAFCAGQPSPLPALPIQYADFAVWQREWLQDKKLEKQLTYWKQHLADTPSVLELPTDRPRPATQTFRGATHSLTLSESLSRTLKKLSQQEGSTLFMTLLAAFEILLYRYIGQEDIVVGTPIANRNRSKIEGLIGFFVNTLVLRTDFSGDPPFLKRQILMSIGS